MTAATAFRPDADTAVLLIDVQESFRHRPYWDPAGFEPYMARTNALLTGAAARGLPIVRILHTDGPATPDNPFSLVSGHVRPMAELANVPIAAEFLKRRHSALAGTGLSIWLTEHGIRRLIVAGIRTEQCCETTTRHASDEGWTVDYVTEATLTFPIRHASGVVVGVDELKLRTEVALQDRFAQIVDVEAALDRATQRSAVAA
ncbi:MULTISPECIES: cysteine hydrolase family protein [unclassified Roseateles]|uniref:cysteine hydrolase family protein n=1 Tax=unclassified Roseateles TaxID=2626991 RepID=UPI00161805E8|nr:MULTISPECIES: isochorismatase family protein [unclassified Roseateles]MBB3284662.1 nicotinamidase-related amidase [Mitsuaria sp. BK037]MBB3291809.1 nicotinamidase-related amidase [Mitsuaria sp. BK041]MBB3361026.1 nicotinamidase-related amidase [Mitsuaria sp. BK045]